MPKPNVTVEDVSDSADVLGAEVDNENASSAWDTNQMMRADGDPEDEPLEPLEDDDADDDQELDEDGNPVDPEEADAEEGEEDDEDGDEEDADEEEEELAPIDPPANWPEQERKFFAELSPQLQHAYLQRARYMQSDYQRKTGELANVRRAYQDFDRVIAPHVQSWALNGMNPAQAVQQLIALSDFATKDAPGFIQYFAKLRGVDIGKLVQAESTEYVDPQVAAVRKEVAAVRAMLNQSTTQTQQQQRAQQQAQYQQTFAQTNSALDTFAAQRGQDGKPAYPYFNEVQDEMATLIEAANRKGAPITVHDAYQTAVHMNPFTRSKMLARHRSTVNAKARERAVQARQAASSITGAASANGGMPSTDGMSIRDLLHAGFEGAI